MSASRTSCRVGSSVRSRSGTMRVTPTRPPSAGPMPPPPRKPNSGTCSISTSAMIQRVVGSQPAKSIPAALRTALRPPSQPTRYCARSDVRRKGRALALLRPRPWSVHLRVLRSMPAPHGLRQVRLLPPQGYRQAQLLEAKANLLRLKQEIPLTDEEIDAIDDGSRQWTPCAGSSPTYPCRLDRLRAISPREQAYPVGVG